VENDESWYPTTKSVYDKMDGVGRTGRLRFPWPLFAYPFYLFNRSPGGWGRVAWPCVVLGWAGLGLSGWVCLSLLPLQLQPGWVGAGCLALCCPALYCVGLGWAWSEWMGLPFTASTAARVGGDGIRLSLGWVGLD
jgi:hypothetical protein